MPTRRAWATAIGPPLLAFLLGRTLLSVAAVTAGYNPFRVETWGRWDSGHYIWIAKSGYVFYYCPPPIGQTCGNAAWMPAYPAVMRLFALSGLSVETAGVVVAAIFAFSTLALLWNGFLDRGRARGSAACILLAAVFPGVVYQHAIFPISMMTFFFIVSIWSLRRGRWILAAAAGAVAAATYQIGFLTAAVLAVGLLSDSEEPWRRRLAKTIGAGAIVGCGLGFLLLTQKLQTGFWDAFLRVERGAYGRGVHNPLANLWTIIRPLFTGGLQLPRDAAVIQTVGVLVLLGAAFLIWLRRGGEVDSQLVVAGAMLWIVSLSLGAATSWHTLSLYRQEATVVPAMLVLRHLPTPILVAGSVVLGGLCFVMGQLFFRGILV